ncbi:MAG: phosphate ABC transporter permease PstA [SAR324 cluster bacterium]|nr:phosphate ABC transporter permease PstA [SAR324 cluster bacterium]
MSNSDSKKPYWSIGEPMVWITGLALSITLLSAIILLLVVMRNGLGVFWPSEVLDFQQKDGSRAIGVLMQTEDHPHTGKQRFQLYTGNRDIYGLDFRWVDAADIRETSVPEKLIVLERMEYGNYLGFLKNVESPASHALESQELTQKFEEILDYAHERKKDIEAIEDQITEVNYAMENILRHELKLKYKKVPGDDPEFQEIKDQKAQLQKKFQDLMVQQNQKIQELSVFTAEFEDASGKTNQIPVMNIVRFFYPNQMSVPQKVGFYIGKIHELLFDEPREANTEGGLLPAIFGTVIMVLLMSMFSFPLGVITAVYLREYAKEGFVVRLVRIAVNNLAGIPSIVYGVFGLGFFVYGIGSTIDQLFFPEVLPTPTFGTGGILWASLTLSLLTVPVVIVATEEALGSIPSGIREGSLALGATRFQTLMRVVLPMSSPGIMTGFILAMARAAGEVAPLMITGVVKLAPSLPIDGRFPFVHLERKFMHLGFHIYDVGFQSPNVEAAKPMVFVTTFLLVLIVLGMSSVAIYMRNKMKKRYTIKSF